MNRTYELRTVVERIGILLAVEAHSSNSIPVALDELVAEVVKERRAAATRAGLTLGVHLDPDVPCVSGDPYHLQPAVDCLIENTHKFTPAGGRVEVRVYAEAGWAFLCDGGSELWEFQFGIDYSPARPTGVIPAPFFAVNTRIREEVDFGGNVTVQTGMQWRGETGRLLRAGAHYFNGKTDQYQFFTEHEEQIGFGVWYDY